MGKRPLQLTETFGRTKGPSGQLRTLRPTEGPLCPREGPIMQIAVPLYQQRAFRCSTIKYAHYLHIYFVYTQFIHPIHLGPLLSIGPQGYKIWAPLAKFRLRSCFKGSVAGAFASPGASCVSQGPDEIGTPGPWTSRGWPLCLLATPLMVTKCFFFFCMLLSPHRPNNSDHLSYFREPQFLNLPCLSQHVASFMIKKIKIEIKASEKVKTDSNFKLLQ